MARGRQKPSWDAPADVDAFLAKVPEDKRPALENLRKTIRSAAPKATEGIGYAIPTFYQEGPLVSYSFSKNHCSFHIMSPAVAKAHEADLKPYDTTTATIRFAPDNPLPAALVRKLVKARIKENQARTRG
jgi:uncharacterized protein YdhG (YjbR/CyaY superfamily)